LLSASEIASDGFVSESSPVSESECTCCFPLVWEWFGSVWAAAAVVAAGDSEERKRCAHPRILVSRLLIGEAEWEMEWEIVRE